jgi:hypothetical protein
MRTWFVVILIGVCMIGSETRSASGAEGRAYFVGNQLHEYCQSTELWQKSECRGYVAGVVDTLKYVGKNGKYEICISDLVSRGQLRDIAKKYLENHPEMRHYLGWVLVYNSMRDAFPCN